MNCFAVWAIINALLCYEASYYLVLSRASLRVGCSREASPQSAWGQAAIFTPEQVRRGRGSGQLGANWFWEGKSVQLGLTRRDIHPLPVNV